VVDSNFLSGTVPGSLFSLPAAETISMSRNAFFGALPDITGLQSLGSFDISTNSITGNFPVSFTSVPALSKLLLIVYTFFCYHHSNMLIDDFHLFSIFESRGYLSIGSSSHRDWSHECLELLVSLGNCHLREHSCRDRKYGCIE
jgi:hypothetical protein